MKAILPLLLTGLVSAQQCIEVQMLAPLFAVRDALNDIEPEDETEEEYFEKFGKGFVNGFTKGGQRTGTWTFYQDADNWKKVTYDKWGDVILWQRLIAGRRLFEISYDYHTLLDTGELKVYELSWTENKVLDWKLVDEVTNYLVINEHGHWLNPDGTPSAQRSNFGEKYKWGDKFKESIMGVPQE